MPVWAVLPLIHPRWCRSPLHRLPRPLRATAARRARASGCSTRTGRSSIARTCSSRVRRATPAGPSSARRLSPHISQRWKPARSSTRETSTRIRALRNSPARFSHSWKSARSWMFPWSMAIALRECCTSSTSGRRARGARRNGSVPSPLQRASRSRSRTRNGRKPWRPIYTMPSCCASRRKRRMSLPGNGIRTPT